jgi:hypothetical protein
MKPSPILRTNQSTSLSNECQEVGALYNPMSYLGVSPHFWLSGSISCLSIHLFLHLFLVYQSGHTLVPLAFPNLDKQHTAILKHLRRGSTKNLA